MNKKIFLIAVITLLMDQITKGLVEVCFELNKSMVLIKNFFYITFCRNEGAAWSILSNQKIVLIISSLIALVIIYRYMYLFKINKRNNLAFGLLVGGIVGNLIDRVLYGYVRDFIDFYIFKYDYPVFNIADIAIVIGIVLLIVAIIKGEDKKDANSSRRK